MIQAFPEGDSGQGLQASFENLSVNFLFFQTKMSKVQHIDLSAANFLARAYTFFCAHTFPHLQKGPLSSVYGHITNLRRALLLLAPDDILNNYCLLLLLLLLLCRTGLTRFVRRAAKVHSVSGECLVLPHTLSLTQISTKRLLDLIVVCEKRARRRRQRRQRDVHMRVRAVKKDCWQN